ncbi:MAG: PHP domain-containing protein [Candidatus Brockarchaeota archaeon]|nr:PHP domain-containing protein [Candidatus Brockarchaeota archaeon]
MQRFDLHIHTFFSRDSWIDPKLLPKVAESRGLRGFAITDHNRFGAHRMIEAGSMLVVPGVEIRTNVGDLIALFIQEPVDSSDPFEIHDVVKSQDGVLIAAHPFGFPRVQRSASKKIYELLDGVEVVNARNILRGQNEKALELAKRLGKAEVGGSDAHTMREVGRAYTLADASSLEELRSAIKRKSTCGSGMLSTPLVHLASFAARIMHIISH